MSLINGAGGHPALDGEGNADDTDTRAEHGQNQCRELSTLSTPQKKKRLEKNQVMDVGRRKVVQVKMIE